MSECKYDRLTEYLRQQMNEFKSYRNGCIFGVCAVGGIGEYQD
jgi:hypothetical protein